MSTIVEMRPQERRPSSVVIMDRPGWSRSPSTAAGSFSPSATHGCRYRSSRVWVGRSSPGKARSRTRRSMVTRADSAAGCSGWHRSRSGSRTRSTARRTGSTTRRPTSPNVEKARVRKRAPGAGTRPSWPDVLAVLQTDDTRSACLSRYREAGFTPDDFGRSRPAVRRCRTP